MALQIHLYFILVPVLLLFAAMFAASEAALFSLSRPQLESLREVKPKIYRWIRKLTYQPDSLLSTIIIGNECLNILIATFIAELLQLHLADDSGTLVIVFSVLLSSALLLTCSEILPKVLAFRMPILTASLLVLPTAVAHQILTPVRRVFLSISSFILQLVGVQPRPPSVVNEKDFLTLVDVGAESGSLEKDEKQLIYNVFNFSDLSVANVMTPWDQVFFLDDISTPEQVLSRVRKKRFSRIPVFSSNENHVVGILYTKELLKLLLSPNFLKEPEILKRSIFPPYVVSVHKKVSKLFREFKIKKVHMALVVDEYGKHLGVITLEDVLNALFRTTRKGERSIA